MSLTVIINQPVVPRYRVPLFNALAEDSGLRVLVAASRDLPGLPQSELGDARFPIQILQGRCLLNGKFYWQSRLLSTLASADVLVLWGNPRALSSMVLGIVAHKRGIPTLWWGHGWSPTSRPATEYFRNALMRVIPSAILLYTHDEAAYYVKKGLSSKRVFYLNNTIDTKEVDEAISEWSNGLLNSFKKEKGLEKTINLLVCGRVIIKANTEIVLKAFSVVAKQHKSPLKLVVIGDGPELEKCKCMANSIGVNNYVLWVGELTKEAEIAPYFMSSTLFVYGGNIGLSLNHAFAYGRPVVIHDDYKKHNPEIAYFRNGINGIAFRSGDPVDLASKIGSILVNPSLVDRLSKCARSTVDEVCPFSGMVSRFKEAVRAVSRISGADVIK